MDYAGSRWENYFKEEVCWHKMKVNKGIGLEDEVL